MTRASGSAAGSVGSATEVAKRRQRSCSRRRWAPMRCCFARRSYEFFAARWPSRTGALADRLNSLPKYVVSSTLQDPAWNNSTVLRGDVVSEVSKLKQPLDADIVVYASFQLVRTLMEHDLADELRLMVYPVVLGPASASSARPATRSPCASSAPGPSVTTSPTSPTSPFQTRSYRCVVVGWRAPPWRPPPSAGCASPRAQGGGA